MLDSLSANIAFCLCTILVNYLLISRLFRFELHQTVCAVVQPSPLNGSHLFAITLESAAPTAIFAPSNASYSSGFFLCPYPLHFWYRAKHTVEVKEMNRVYVKRYTREELLYHSTLLKCIRLGIHVVMHALINISRLSCF